MNPNILFLVIDSFRADKCFGKTKTSKSPNLEKLIKKGVYFTQSISSANGTGPSLACLFTGLYPFKSEIQEEKHSKLSPKVQNFVKILKNHNYNTYGTVTVQSDYLGLTDEFEFKETYSSYSRLSSGLDNQILEKFEFQKLKEPWFYYIHLLDLHPPIEVPKEFRDEKFGDNSYEKMVSYVDSFLEKLLLKVDLKNTLLVITADHGEVIVPKRFIKKFDVPSKKNTVGRKIPKALIPIASSVYRFYEQKTKDRIRNEVKKYNISPYEKRSILLSEFCRLVDDPDERLMYEDRLRVPLIFVGYGINQHKIIDEQVRNSVDVFPTIMDIIGLAEKYDTVDGESLVPLIVGKEFNEKPVYLESGHSLENNLLDVIGIRTPEYKYFRKKCETEENGYLFDLKKDPLEEQNLIKTNTDIVKKMENLIRDIKSNTKTTIEFEKITDSEQKQIEKELRRMGYL